MAMLAEPRQRKRYNLTPRGKALYEDDSRFGTKMLEKMGWSKGKGLGANENGNQDFVRVRMRNTNEGLGFQDRDDHWTQHEQNFNGLLKSLNGDGDVNNEAGEDKESASDEEAPRVGFGFTPDPKKPKVEKLKDKISGVSLEEKSKLSKARVHYGKFTKGKDIAQYSEKDLANIFGKKVVEAVQPDGIYAELTAITSKEKIYEKEESASAEEKEVKPNFGGVQTISTGLSVSEYFKRKMEAMKSKPKRVEEENDEGKDVQISEDFPKGDSVEIKAKQKKRKRKEKTVESENKSTDSEYSNQTDETVKLEVKKEKVRNKLISGTPELEIKTPLSDTIIQVFDNLIESKKDKKKKYKQIELADLAISEQNLDSGLPKKKKSKDHEEEQQFNKEDAVIVDKEATKKSKAKKSKLEQSHVNSDAIASDTGAEILIPKTLEKKKKHKSAQNDETVVKKNKKSRNKEKLSADTKNYANLSEREECWENVSQQTTEMSITPSSKKSKKQKKGEKNDQVMADSGSSNHGSLEGQKKTKKDVSEEISFQSLTLDELIAKCNSLNVYTVSSFCAEKFRNVVLDEFKGATISQFPGYSYTDTDLQLNIKNLPGDKQRIIQLWNCRLNKYQEANPSAIFGKYRKNVVSVLYKGKKKGDKKQRKKMPRFNTKSLKRKSVFQPL